MLVICPHGLTSRGDASIAPYTLARPYPFAEESAAGSRQTNLC